MDQAKRKFMEFEFVGLLKDLKPDVKGKWGKMNGQQMVEHMSDYVRIASGKMKVPVVFDGEHAAKSKIFLMSEKPFKENTPNQLLPDEPEAWKNKTMDDAIAELSAEIKHFFELYDANPEKKEQSPFFGELNFEEQVQLLHKHTVHHAKQFGLL